MTSETAMDAAFPPTSIISKLGTTYAGQNIAVNVIEYLIPTVEFNYFMQLLFHSGLSELPKCIEDIDLPTCEDANKTEVIQEAEIFFTSEWEHLGFHPTTGTCNASAVSTPMYNDHISQREFITSAVRPIFN